MIAVDHGVAQLVVLVAEFQHGLAQLRALRQAQALGQAPGGDVAHDHFQGNDAHTLDQRLAVGQLLHKMRGHAFLFQELHQVVGHAVVDGALALNGALLQAVEGGGVVLVVHQHEARIVGRKYLLGLAFVKLFHLFHGNCLLKKIKQSDSIKR